MLTFTCCTLLALFTDCTAVSLYIALLAIAGSNDLLCEALLQVRDCTACPIKLAHRIDSFRKTASPRSVGVLAGLDGAQREAFGVFH